VQAVVRFWGQQEPGSLHQGSKALEGPAPSSQTGNRFGPCTDGQIVTLPLTFLLFSCAADSRMPAFPSAVASATASCPLLADNPASGDTWKKLPSRSVGFDRAELFSSTKFDAREAPHTRSPDPQLWVCGFAGKGAQWSSFHKKTHRQQGPPRNETKLGPQKSASFGFLSVFQPSLDLALHLYRTYLRHMCLEMDRWGLARQMARFRCNPIYKQIGVDAAMPSPSPMCRVGFRSQRSHGLA
jgi:hypothetical protein